MDKNHLPKILLGIMVIICLVILSERLFPSLIHRKNYVRSAEELNQKITEHLQRGESSFSTYVEGMDEESLSDINHYTDGFFGYVTSYTMIRKLKSDVYQVHFDMEVSDNYYAYLNVTKGIDISGHPEAAKLAGHVKSILSQYKSLSDYEKVVAYHDYIVMNCSYGFLPEDESNLSYTATGCLLHGTCVCNGYAEAMQLLLLCSDIDTRMVIGTADGVSHAWVMVNLDDAWYHVDPTWDDPVPDVKNTAIHVYLNVNDAVLSRTHTWNRSAYPVCESMDANYYNRSGSGFDNFNSFKSYVLTELQHSNQVEAMATNTDTVKYDCGFVLHEAGAKKVSWQTYEEGKYQVFLIRSE